MLVVFFLEHFVAFVLSAILKVIIPRGALYCVVQDLIARISAVFFSWLRLLPDEIILRHTAGGHDIDRIANAIPLID